MNAANLARSVAAALMMAAAGSAALAQNNDAYTRLFEMNEMDRNKDGMVAKEEFLAMVAKLWDMHSLEMKIKGDKMTPAQLKEIEKILGRTFGSR